MNIVSDLLQKLLLTSITYKVVFSISSIIKGYLKSKLLKPVVKIYKIVKKQTIIVTSLQAF